MIRLQKFGTICCVKISSYCSLLLRLFITRFVLVSFSLTLSRTVYNLKRTEILD